MSQYFSPGVYVEEVPSAEKAIAGVGTSTAAFIGIVPDTIEVPVKSRLVRDEKVGVGDGTTAVFTLRGSPVKGAGVYQVRVDGVEFVATLANDPNKGVSTLTFAAAPVKDAALTGDFTYASFGVTGEQLGDGNGHDTQFALPRYPVKTGAGESKVYVDGTLTTGVTLGNDSAAHRSTITFDTAPAAGTAITGDVIYESHDALGERIGVGDGKAARFKLPGFPVRTDNFKVRVGDYLAPAIVTNDEVSIVTFTSPPGPGASITGDFIYDYKTVQFPPTAAGTPQLCTTFGDFKRLFGDFSLDPGQHKLAHAVYGFFNNGGTRCYVVRVTAATDIAAALERLAAVDEVALVAAPGIVDPVTRSAIVDHCTKSADRFAILDCDDTIGTGADPDLMLLDPSNPANKLPDNTDFGAFYFPWIQVFDQAAKIADPFSDGLVFVPPSGHLAGIYARVDTERGVHKAPANEVVRGALGLKYQISKAQQDGLNPQGVNAIRELNGNIRVWGARTIGGNSNADLKYINVRRTLLFLRESIDEGTQWVVFEPNTPGLWAKITRNISAFLTNVWRSGALFGTTAQQAFYVKCDAETNPPELRELGQVVTEIGVSIVRPAEFVIFRISQFTAPGK